MRRPIAAFGRRRNIVTFAVLSALAATLIGCTASGSATTELSKYLTEPELMREHLIESIQFWEQVRDDEHGGFFTAIDRDGSVGDPERKSLLVQSQNAYGFSRAFMVTGDERYLDHAEHALSFLYEHGWDGEHGGWFFSVDRDGDLLPVNQWWDANTFRWIFTQHHALLGIAATYEASREQRELDWLHLGMATTEEHLWDSVHGGYFERAALDWSDRSGKGFTGTVDGITTHALTAHLTLNEPRYRDRLFSLADITASTIVGSMDEAAVTVGFARAYESNWSVQTDDSAGTVGNQLQVIRSLSRAHLLNPDPRYRDAAERLFADMVEHGMLDAERGGAWMGYDYVTGEIEREQKDHRMAGCAITAGITLAQVSEDPEIRKSALSMASSTLDFYMHHFVDSEFGEAFSQVAPDGTPTNETKGDFFRGAYQTVETAYLTYLYASFFLMQEPVELYYRFPAAPEARVVTLSPIAAPDLQITGVKLDGESWPGFSIHRDATARSLRIPAGVGGVFAVTFAPSKGDQ